MTNHQGHNLTVADVDRALEKAERLAGMLPSAEAAAFSLQMIAAVRRAPDLSTKADLLASIGTLDSFMSGAISAAKHDNVMGEDICEACLTRDILTFRLGFRSAFRIMRNAMETH